MTPLRAPGSGQEPAEISYSTAVGATVGSVGRVGSVDAGTEPEQAEDAVVRQADAAMYADKASRR